MKAALSDDWNGLKVGSITVSTNEGTEIAVIGFLSVNYALVNIRNFQKEMHQLAERLVDDFNKEKV